MLPIINFFIIKRCFYSSFRRDKSRRLGNKTKVIIKIIEEMKKEFLVAYQEKTNKIWIIQKKIVLLHLIMSKGS